MKIKSIKISNILSYKYYEYISSSECPKIEFDSKDNNFHILIGPNGSGKSNFLEIINQIFRNILFKQCQFNKNIFKNHDTSSFEREKKQILQSPNQNISHLNRNWHHRDSPQKLLLSLLLNDDDYNNLDFVVDNSQKIDEYLQTYSNFGAPSFTNLVGDDITTFKQGIREQKVHVLISRKNEGESFTVSILGKNNEKKFIKQYLEYFEFLQSVIDIHNTKNSEDTWEPLKDTFTLIGCYRNYDKVVQEYPAQDDENSALSNLRNKRYQDTTLFSKNDEPVIFELIKHKFTYDGLKLLHEGEKSTKEIIKAIYDTSLYKSIDSLLRRFLGISLKIGVKESSNWILKFDVIKDKQEIGFQNLSAGQKAITHLIFALYGYDVKNGLFIIDEPELHLHPQLQKKYIAIAKEESKNRDIQFIISTHSPVFISEKTINNVKRFYFNKQEKTSRIIQPQISKDDKLLIKVLNYTNASKIFFVDRAILVEGESDEYFFNFYINFLKENDTENGKKIDDFEIYNIEGKGEYEKWKEFLKKWELKVYYVGDWDNVKDFKLISKDDLNTCKQKLKESVLKKINSKVTNKNSKDGKALLGTLFDYIENTDEEKFEELKKLALYLFERFTPYEEVIRCLQNDNKLNAINTQIDSKYKDGVYILKNGELEDYLDTQGKKLSQIIDFCNNFDSSKLKNEEELKNIVKHIFK